MKGLALKNLIRNPGRTTALTLLILLLALALFGGGTVVRSLQNGLDSLEARLGADIIVVPATAASKTDLNNLYLQGTTGYFYMNADRVSRIAEAEGIEKLSTQLFLASMRADCCSIPVQVIGLDQETDFSVRPWITQSYQQELGLYDVVAGCKVNAQVGESVKLFGESCRVVARLAETGTGLDTAIYADMSTLRLLLKAGQELGQILKISGDADQVVSAVYIKVRDGYDVQAVTDYINVHSRNKYKAVRTRSMVTDVSDSLSRISSIIGWLVAAIGALAVLVLLIAFTMLTNERKREFAVLRVCGASRRMLAGMLRREALALGALGALCGIALGALLILSFRTLLETRLGLPFLLPDLSGMLILGGITLILCLLAGMIASARAVYTLSRVDTGVILREGN